MYLSGGPGGAGRERDAERASARCPGLEDRFRLIGYDQRGTGRSGLLRCPRLEKDPHLRDTGAAEECANRLGVARSTTRRRTPSRTWRRSARSSASRR